MGNRFVDPVPQALDDVGVSEADAQLFFFASGTSTPLDTFSDETLTTPNTNPVVADSAGRFSDIFLSDANYKVQLKTSVVNGSVQEWERDPVWGTISLDSNKLVITVSTYTELRALSGQQDGDVVFVSGGTAIDGTFSFDNSQIATDNGGTIIDGWIREFSGHIDAKWFEATGDGSTDDTAALQAALDYVATNDGVLIIPDGNYSITGTLISDSENSRRIRIIGQGLAKILWNGSSSDIVLDLRRWTNTCELSDIIFENTIQAANVTGIRMTCFTGSGTTTSGTVDMAWLHDLVIGQPDDLGFERGLQCGDVTAFGSGEFFTYINFDRILYRHCNFGMFIDATTFDLCQIRGFNANGGGTASDGSDANATTHLRSITNVDHLLITGFNSNRCTSYAIDLIGGGVDIRGSWYEQSGGGFRMTSSGSPRPVIIEDAKFTSSVLDGSGRSVDYNGLGTISVTDCEFDTGDLHIQAEQQLVHSGNEFINSATITRIDNRFVRTFNRHPLGQSAPHWETVTLLFSDFSSASTTIIFDIPVSDEPTSTVIHDVILRAKIGFNGGSVSAATLDFGIDTDATGFFTGPNVFNTGPFRLTDQSDLGTLLWDTTDPSPRRFLMTSAKTLRATLQLTGGNGNTLTAGECQVSLLTSAVFAGEEYFPEVFDTIIGS